MDKNNNDAKAPATDNSKKIEEIESHILKRYDLINKQGIIVFFNFNR